jgi:hydroxyacylglutathione hydrolase
MARFAQDSGVTTMFGFLSEAKWIHGSADCRQNTDSPFQVQRLDENTLILRQNKCTNFEGPFLYLLFGAQEALLMDTGARPPAGTIVPVRETVDGLIREWSAAHNKTPTQLVVAHTHSHGDHVAGDYQFADRPNTSVVKPQLESVKSFFGFTNWPDGAANLDLGGRMLTIFPIPGHEESHIAVYDNDSQFLFTGDTLYPGLLTVDDWSSYRQSAARLFQFSQERNVSIVLGAHIEMKNVPRQLYPLPCTFQPEEHALPLRAEHIRQLHEACERMGNNPHRDVHDEFIIEPLQ